MKALLRWPMRSPGKAWLEQYETLDEHYDLVVVGAGMSGLAAAWYYRRKMGSEAKILLLDNHDDFGGHAKRNEFHHEGRMVLDNGGAQQIDSPNAWSESSKELLLGLGIDQRALDQMDENTPDDYVLGEALSADFLMTVPGPGGYMTISDHWFRFHAWSRAIISKLLGPARSRGSAAGVDRFCGRETRLSQ